MMKIASIVEGHGEVQALPVLLRRLAQWMNPGSYVDVLQPIRVRRDRFLNRPEEFRRHVLFAASKAGEQGWVLVLLDADDDCPATTGPEILQRAQDCAPAHRVSVVLANREYEAWFLAAARSLVGVRGFACTDADAASIDPEEPRDAKGWLGRRMPSNYGEVLDQPAFSARMDLRQAYDGCRSFRKLCSEWAGRPGGMVP